MSSSGSAVGQDIFELFQFGPGFNSPTFDPFCLSVQCYLNLANIKWLSNECSNPKISPNGDLPVLKLGTNTVVAGRSAIFKFLADRNHDLDYHLSPLQKAESLAYYFMHGFI